MLCEKTHGQKHKRIQHIKQYPTQQMYIAIHTKKNHLARLFVPHPQISHSLSLSRQRLTVRCHQRIVCTMCRCVCVRVFCLSCERNCKSYAPFFLLCCVDVLFLCSSCRVHKAWRTVFFAHTKSLMPTRKNRDRAPQHPSSPGHLPAPLCSRCVCVCTYIST